MHVFVAVKSLSLGSERDESMPTGQVLRGLVVFFLAGLAAIGVSLDQDWNSRQRTAWAIGWALAATAVTLVSDQFLLKSPRTRFAGNVPVGIVGGLILAFAMGPSPLLVTAAVAGGVLAGLVRPPP